VIFQKNSAITNKNALGGIFFEISLHLADIAQIDIVNMVGNSNFTQYENEK